MNLNIFGSHAKTIVPVLFTTMMSTVKGIGVLAVGAAITVNAQAAITEADVKSYAAVMKQAANDKDINAISNLVAKDALISLSRRGKTTSLDKSAYLKLLQDSWSKTNNYKYDISVANIVTSGNQAKADIVTIETWTKEGRDTTVNTSSRATLKEGEGNALLLRAVSQVTIE